VGVRVQEAALSFQPANILPEILMASYRSTLRYRPTVEALEERWCPTGLAGQVLVGQFLNHPGDVFTVTAVPGSSDAGEDAEAEPLVIQFSDGDSFLVPEYGSVAIIKHPATQANESIYYNFLGGDGDESADVSADYNEHSVLSDAVKQAAQFLDQHQNLVGLAVSAGMNYVLPGTSSLLGKALPAMNGIISGTLGLGVAEGIDFLAKDPPDPNFTHIAHSAAPRTNFLTKQLHGLPRTLTKPLGALVADEAQAIGLCQAIYVSGNRASGAALLQDVKWEARQRAAVRKYAHQLAHVLRAEVKQLLQTSRVLQAFGFSSPLVTPDNVSQFERDLSSTGLPSETVADLQALGANDATIQRIQQALVVQDPQKVAANIPLGLADPAFLAALETTAAALAQS
jgi:hypothetical protein